MILGRAPGPAGMLAAHAVAIAGGDLVQCQLAAGLAAGMAEASSGASPSQAGQVAVLEMKSLGASLESRVLIAAHTARNIVISRHQNKIQSYLRQYNTTDITQ